MKITDEIRDAVCTAALLCMADDEIGDAETMALISALALAAVLVRQHPDGRRAFDEVDRRARAEMERRKAERGAPS